MSILFIIIVLILILMPLIVYYSIYTYEEFEKITLLWKIYKSISDRLYILFWDNRSYKYQVFKEKYDYKRKLYKHSNWYKKEIDWKIIKKEDWNSKTFYIEKEKRFLDTYTDKEMLFQEWILHIMFDNKNIFFDILNYEWEDELNPLKVSYINFKWEILLVKRGHNIYEPFYKEFINDDWSISIWDLIRKHNSQFFFEEQEEIIKNFIIDSLKVSKYEILNMNEENRYKKEFRKINWNKRVLQWLKRQTGFESTFNTIDKLEKDSRYMKNISRYVKKKYN